ARQGLPLLRRDEIIQVARVNLARRVENVKQQLLCRLVLQRRWQVGADLEALIFQAMTGGAVLLEHRLAASAVALQVERRAVRIDHPLPIRGHLSGEKFPGALPQPGIAVLAKLLETGRLQLSCEDRLLLDGIEQRVQTSGLCEKGLQTLAA